VYPGRAALGTGRLLHRESRLMNETTMDRQYLKRRLGRRAANKVDDSANLSGNLYKLWHRYPQPVARK
jgi:hypothetical protein